MKTTILKYVGCALLVTSAGVAFADGTFSLTGTVPAMTTADVIWMNPHLGLDAATGATAPLNTPIGAFQVYSNDAAGFDINATSTNAGSLKGGVTSVLVAYQVAMFASEANAVAGTTFLAFPGTAGTDSAYTTALATATLIFFSGTLTSPVDTGSGAGAYWVGTQIAASAIKALMADTYTDTLTISIAGL